MRILHRNNNEQNKPLCESSLKEVGGSGQTSWNSK